MWGGLRGCWRCGFCCCGGGVQVLLGVGSQGTEGGAAKGFVAGPLFFCDVHI